MSKKTIPVITGKVKPEKEPKMTPLQKRIAQITDASITDPAMKGVGILKYQHELSELVKRLGQFQDDNLLKCDFEQTMAFIEIFNHLQDASMMMGAVCELLLPYFDHRLAWVDIEKSVTHYVQRIDDMMRIVNSFLGENPCSTDASKNASRPTAIGVRCPTGVKR